MKLYISTLLVILVLIAVGFGVFKWQRGREVLRIVEDMIPMETNEDGAVDMVDDMGTEDVEEEEVLEPEDGVAEEVMDMDEVAEEGDAATTGMQVYTNAEYGFELSYPDVCEAMDDATNLYGWTNGIVLFYCGGQAYDVAVEVWDSLAEYEAKYPDEEFVGAELAGQYVSVVDITNEPQNTDILASFEVL
jgi:hypothetical protein